MDSSKHYRVYSNKLLTKLAYSRKRWTTGSRGFAWSCALRNLCHVLVGRWFYRQSSTRSIEEGSLSATYDAAGIPIKFGFRYGFAQGYERFLEYGTDTPTGTRNSNTPRRYTYCIESTIFCPYASTQKESFRCVDRNLHGCKEEAVHARQGICWVLGIMNIANISWFKEGRLCWLLVQVSFNSNYMPMTRKTTI